MRRTEGRAVRVAFALLAVAGMATAPGCVSALREPPPLEDIAAEARSAGSGRFADADQLWHRRTMKSVRAAVSMRTS